MRGFPAQNMLEASHRSHSEFKTQWGLSLGTWYVACALIAVLALEVGCGRSTSELPREEVGQRTDTPPLPDDMAIQPVEENEASPQTDGTAERPRERVSSQAPELPAGVVPRKRSPSGPSHVGIPRSLPTPGHGDAKSWEPRVVMSHAHAATCLVHPQDKMPPMELPDLEGQVRTLPSLLGNRLTVVVFWNSRLDFAREQYLRLPQEIVAPFEQHGVQVIAINTGDSHETVRRLAGRTEGKLINLLDVDRSALSKVATERLPRTYLLDSSGTILWMDIEYSQGTRRELHNAILYYLKLEG